MSWSLSMRLLGVDRLLDLDDVVDVDDVVVGVVVAAPSSAAAAAAATSALRTWKAAMPMPMTVGRNRTAAGAFSSVPNSVTYIVRFTTLAGARLRHGSERQPGADDREHQAERQREVGLAVRLLAVGRPVVDRVDDLVGGGVGVVLQRRPRR